MAHTWHHIRGKTYSCQVIRHTITKNDQIEYSVFTRSGDVLGPPGHAMALLGVVIGTRERRQGKQRDYDYVRWTARVSARGEKETYIAGHFKHRWQAEVALLHRFIALEEKHGSR